MPGNHQRQLHSYVCVCVLGGQSGLFSIPISSVPVPYPLCLLLPLSVPLCRSQRDIAGEKELREKRLQELQKKLARLEGEMATAENDKRQFDADTKRASEQYNIFK